MTYQPTTSLPPSLTQYDADLVGGRHARNELELLSALLKLKPPPSDNFKLNLFGEDDYGGAAGAGGSKVQTLTFGVGGKNEAYRTGAAGLGKVIKTLQLGEAGKADTDDLLDLLDKT